MTDGVFLQAIRDNPNDDGPRLVYADWLEERGDCDRAEFIRVQCELEHAPDDGRWAALKRREAELLDAHRREWLGRWQPGPHVALRRGFLTVGRDAGVAAFTAPDFDVPLLLDWAFERASLRYGPELMRHVTRLYFCEPKIAEPAAVLAAYDWPRLTSVQGRLPDVQAAVDQMPRVPTLRWLAVVDHTADAGGLRRLLDAVPPGRLTGLMLACRKAGPRVAELVAGHPALAGLRHLDLSACGVSDRGVRTIAAAPHLGRLTSLRLRDNQLGLPGLTTVLDGPVAAHLTVLDVSHNFLGGASLRGLLASPVLGRLTELHVGSDLTDDDLATLAASPAVCGLRRLGLQGRYINRDGVQALADSPMLHRLTHLTLDSGTIGRQLRVGGLTDATGPVRLTDLELHHVQLGSDMVQRLLTAPGLPRLRRLYAPGVEPVELRDWLQGRFGDRLEM